MKKWEAMKVGGVQREEKGKKSVSWVEKLIFLLAMFSLLLFVCTSKMISGAWGSALITF
jgi:hypothetical protein